VVDLESSTDATKNADYEYYYLYYDEDGHIVGNNSATPSKAEAETAEPAGQNSKLQEIALQAASSNADEKTGDTPTIYAQIKDDDKSDAEKVDEPKEEGFTIFGLPIPKIPVSLSFGLAPAIASGLLPIPSIGRKGDSLDGEEVQHPPPVRHDTQGHISKGPDSIDPIWVETGLKAASDILLPKLASLGKQALGMGGGGDDVVAERKGQQPPQQEQRPQGPQMYSYQHPRHPVIPLQADQSPPLPLSSSVKRQGEYYPKGFIPAITFDHPLPAGHHQHNYGGGRILPPPPQHGGHHQTPSSPSDRHDTYVRGPNLGSPQDHVNGFRPLFRPHRVDPNWKVMPKPSAFPGIDATLAEASDPSPSLRPPRQPQPAIEFSSPPSVSTSSSSIPEEIGPNAVGQVFAAVPPHLPPGMEPVYEVIAQEERPAIAVEAPPPQPPQAAADETAAYEEYEYYEDPDVQETIQNEQLEKLLSDLRKRQELEEATSQRTVPTLMIEELTSTEAAQVSSSSTSTTTEGQPATTTIEAIEVSHKGTPRTPPSTTTPSEDATVLDGQEEEQVADATTTEASSDKPQYEYEYYYEYYDYDPKDKDVSSTVSTPRQDVGAAEHTTFKSLLGLMEKDMDSQRERPRTGISLPKFDQKLTPHGRRPTPAPPIRTSTALYDGTGNYLESHRSSVTAESVSRVRDNDPIPAARQRPPRPSPYPFHPDSLDPARVPPDADAGVEWYYSGYRNGLEATVARQGEAPQLPELPSSGATKQTLCTTLFLPLLLSLAFLA